MAEKAKPEAEKNVSAAAKPSSEALKKLSAAAAEFVPPVHSWNVFPVSYEPI